MRLLISLVLLAVGSYPVAASVYAIVVGINTYRDDNWQRPWLRYADVDADLFQNYLQQRKFGPNVAVFTDLPRAPRPATLTNIRSQLQMVLGNATVADDVYLFISA